MVANRENEYLADSVFHKIEKGLLDYLDVLELNERIERIDDLIHRLNFERRLSSLAPNQLDNVLNCTLSEPQLAQFDKCKTAIERNAVLHGYARTLYFRDCSWVNYLNGTSSEPPVPAKPLTG